MRMVTADGIDLSHIGMNNNKMGMGFGLRGVWGAFHPQLSNQFPINRVLCMKFTKYVP